MKKAIAWLLRTQQAFGTILLAVFFLTILIQILARYLSISLLWTEELANYSFIWAVFMGASVMIHYKAHFCFTFFKDKFTGRRGALYDSFISAILLCFTVPMCVYGIQITIEFWDYNWISLPWVKMGWTWLCVPLTGLTMSCYLLFQIWENMQLYRKGGDA